MLSHIRIRNFAIIDEAELELSPGMTVLTGETGAGKSILVGALGLVLGDRADSTTVRHGAERAEITASFEIDRDSPTFTWLREQALDSEEECVLRRVISREGRSKSFINGQSVPLRSLTELGEQLVDIHGQHAHQSLLRKQAQMELLDTHGGYSDLANDVALSYRDWQLLAVDLNSMQELQKDREARLDLLQYQVNELDALALQDGELEQLELERKKLAHSGNLIERAQQALQLLFENDDGSAQSFVSQAASLIGGATELDPSLKATLDMIGEADIRISEAAEDLRRYLDGMEIDPERQRQVESRLDSAHELARKHRLEPNQLLVHLATMQTDLDKLENAESRLEELMEKVTRAKENYLEFAKKLSAIRVSNAIRLSSEVSTVMQKLGMPGGRFVCQVTELSESNYSAKGLDDIEFLVTANPGQPEQSIAKVASGGELSRISLAVQVILADSNQVPSLVFDEVDSGIGGGVAEIVGRRLRELSGRCQVMCVTHLPQVASQSHQHLRIIKITDGKTTRTALSQLEGEEKVEELARMLGGVDITTKTREHAQEMITRTPGR
ncbi:MAG: DNA repair protein RecN [Proteobacteria bacterium]|nr:DNA repair protein RecN [Pseudomonadota bacterium]